MKSTALANWSWRKYGDVKWNKCKHSKETTEIFPDLVDAGQIPDPFLDQNEKLVQWVGETDWEYMAEFEYSSSSARADLVFHGLDTYATVQLNGQEILCSSNMFHVHRINVSGKLREGKNCLIVRFDSALRRAKDAEASHKEMHLWNGDSCRLYCRKAQYHFGWDWGPVFLTCGPWKPVILEVYDAQVHDVYIHADVDENLDAKVDIHITVSNLSGDSKISSPAVTAQVDFRDPSGGSVFSERIDIPSGSERIAKSCQVQLRKPKLWYPINYGHQDFYEAIVTLYRQDDDEADRQVPVHSLARGAGLRRVELIEHPLRDQPGTSFFFQVNNIPIYIAGSNWIPAHSFLTQLTRDDYHQWINLAVHGNQNMIRVWAGGVFEDEAFYDACDRAGILVWQDFLFGCGQYPYYKELADSVERECQDQLKRLRNHCSVIVYAGNNEDYQIAEEAKLEWDPNDRSGKWENTNFPGRMYYEVLIPQVLEETIPGAIYRYGCPYGGAFTSDKTVGDIHQWNVWHGTQEKYQDWAKLAGRFVSEFGMLAFPCIKTLKRAITDESELYPQSATMDLHNKADGFERRLALYVMENLRVNGMDLSSWIYATQLMQSECLAYAYRCWRRNWKGPGKEYTSGALVWQLNDCWPVTSWAICDFYRTPKLAYYAIKRENQPIGLGIYRNEIIMENPSGQKVSWLQRKLYKFDIWGVNVTLTDVNDATLEIRTFEVESGDLLSTETMGSVKLFSNCSTELVDHIEVSNSVAVQARLYDSEGEMLARATDWPQPLKYIKVPNRELQVTVSHNQVIVSCKRPVKGVELIYNGPNVVTFADNGFDVFPEDEFAIFAPGLCASDKVDFRYYGMD